MLTYIEPCGWCSSSISSTICPPNVDRSTELRPNLSSSLASTSLISTSDSISISTGSISYEKRERTSSAYIVRSSLGHPNDYYTTKRIDELHGRMDDIQITSFLKFINYHLSLKKDNENLHINDLIKDLSNGHILIDLIEILSSTKLKREHGHTRFHSLINVQYVLDYLKLRIQHINISPHEIISGNRKQILALLWIIMKTFHFPGFRLTNKNCFVENTLLGYGQDRSIILKWLNHILNQCLHPEEISLKNFYIQTWLNGYYLSLIIKYLLPLSLKYLTIKSFDYLKELNSSNKQNFQICLNLSNYCFNTTTIIDYTDKTEKSLFKYFTELQKNIFLILKTNHIEKLIKNNPYTKQILDTVSQTTEHSSHIINDNEQYLVCIEDEEKATGLIWNSIGHSTSNGVANLRIEEKSRLVNDEQEEMKLKRQNRWEKTENLESNSCMINDQNEISKEEEITNKPQLNGTVEEFDQPLIKSQDLDQFASTVADRENEQMIVTNIENQFNEKLEQPEIEVKELQQVIRSNKEDKQCTNEYEKSEQTAASAEEQKHPLPSNEKVEPLEQTTSTITKNENINEKLEQSIIGIEEAQQPLTANEENNESVIKPIESKSCITTNKRLEQHVSEELLQPVLLNKENKQKAIKIGENNYFISTDINENLEQSTIVKSPQSLVSNGKNEQNVIKVTDNEASVTSNGELKQPTIDPEETRSFTVEHEKLDQTSAPIKKVEEFIENKPLESPLYIASEKKTEQIPATIVKNNPITINEKLEQSTMKETPQAIISNEKTTVIPVENKPSIMTGKKLEKPVVIESQQPVVLNGQNNKFTTANKKPSVAIKKPTPTVSSIQENQHFKVSNEQPTTMVKELEQCKVVVELPVQTTATTFKGIKYSDIVNKQTPKTNNDSVQGTASLKKQEPSTVAKKKSISSTMLIEKPKQFLITAEEIEQVSLTNIIKESEQTEVALEKRDQSTAVVEESYASGILNEETRKSPTKNKKSRRSNAKKGKARNSPIKTENPQQSVINNQEEVEPSFPPLNLPTIIHQQKPDNTQSEVQSSSTTPKTSINNENLQNSSALRSRKKKKKKTVSTTTTLIEKSSSSLISTTTTTPNHNLVVVIKECLRNRKIMAFKCVFILVCLCFSIIILVLSHK